MLNILAASSISGCEALGSCGLMLTFQTCRKGKHTTNTLHTLYTHTQRRQGGGTREITVRQLASGSVHTSLLWIAWPPSLQQPARASLPLSQSNWLGMAGGTEQSLTRPPRLCGESDVTFNNYLLCSQHSSHFITEWNSLAPTVTQDEAKGQKTITNNLMVRGTSRQLNNTV